jgi:hypothetical protein
MRAVSVRCANSDVDRRRHHSVTGPKPARDSDDAVIAALWASRGIPYDRRPKRPATIEPADIDTFCAQVGCLCTKYGLSPPFRLRALAAAWAALDIPWADCLRTIETYLTAHAAKCHSGASDRLFRWVDVFLRGPASSLVKRFDRRFLASPSRTQLRATERQPGGRHRHRGYLEYPGYRHSGRR